MMNIMIVNPAQGRNRRLSAPWRLSVIRSLPM